MAEVPKSSKSPGNQLKRLLRKASKSRVSLPTSNSEIAIDTEASSNVPNVPALSPAASAPSTPNTPSAANAPVAAAAVPSVPTVVEEHPLERTSSIALTVPEESAENVVKESQPAEEAASSSSPKEEGKDAKESKESKEGKRRTSLVGRLRRFTIDNKKEKKTTEVVLEQTLEIETEGNASAAVDNDPSNSNSNANAIKPTHIAKRIRDLLTSSPPFYPTTFIATEGMEATAVTAGGSSGGSTDELMGTKFLATLSNQALMTGASDQDSVFRILERTKFSFKSNIHGEFSIASSSSNGSGDQPDNSIMLCAPLFPDDNSKVTLADYKFETVPLDEIDMDGSVSAASWWPPWEWGKSKPATDPPTKVVRVWIPSDTNVSVQFAWWGFRIWLPEPVVKILTDKEIEAVKRASILATALGWLVNHIPTTGLPLELQAVLTVAKALVPVLGYIGGFISWYWSEVTGFDKGKGVVLSATWLLPIALIPGNWDYTPPAQTTPSTPVASPTPAPAPAPTSPTPAPSAPVETPTPPSQGTNPPVGTSPPPSMPTSPDTSPIIVIPGPSGVYAA